MPTAVRRSALRTREKPAKLLALTFFFLYLFRFFFLFWRFGGLFLHGFFRVFTFTHGGCSVLARINEFATSDIAASLL